MTCGEYRGPVDPADADGAYTGQHVSL